MNKRRKLHDGPDSGTIRPKCPFCHQNGLLLEEIPLSDEERIERDRIQKQIDLTDDEDEIEKLMLDPLLKRPVRYQVDYERKYGGWLKDCIDFEDLSEDLSCHLFCLQASPALFHQTDSEDDFYVDDESKSKTLGGLGIHRTMLKKEIRRAGKLNCNFCKLRGANLGCVIQKCTRKFHQPCAHDANYVLVCDNRTNPSFCPKHMTKEYRFNVPQVPGQPKYCVDIQFVVVKNERTKVETFRLSSGAQSFNDYDFYKQIQRYIDATDLEKIDYGDKIECALCKSPFEDLESIVLGHCCPNSHFHRMCLSNYALNCGRFNYKCPICGIANREKFLKNSVAQGVYCPVRDASWEIEKDFDDQLEANQVRACTIPDCSHSSATDTTGTRFEIVVCNTCGFSGSHVACNLELTNQLKDDESFDWTCAACKSCTESCNESDSESDSESCGESCSEL